MGKRRRRGQVLRSSPSRTSGLLRMALTNVYAYAAGCGWMGKPRQWSGASLGGVTGMRLHLVVHREHLEDVAGNGMDSGGRSHSAQPGFRAAAPGSPLPLPTGSLR